MTTFRRIAIAALAAATVTAGSLAVVPTVSALARISCQEKLDWAAYYWLIGWQFYRIGDYRNATIYWALSDSFNRIPC